MKTHTGSIMTTIFLFCLILNAFAVDTTAAELPQGVVFDASSIYDIDNEILHSDVTTTYYYLNGQRLKTPCLYIKNSQTMLPLRIAGEAFGAEISWDNTKKQAILKLKDGNNIIATLNNKNILVNGETKIISSAPMLISNTMYLPFRAIGESMGKYVSYYQYRPEQYFVVMHNKDVPNFEDHEQFHKVWLKLKGFEEPDYRILDYTTNYTVLKDNINNTYLINGSGHYFESNNSNWIVIAGLEEPKVWHYNPSLDGVSHGERELFLSFYNDDTIRIISDNLVNTYAFSLNFDENKNSSSCSFQNYHNGFFYFWEGSLNDNYDIHCINITIPQNNDFVIEQVGEPGYIYGQMFYYTADGALASKLYVPLDFREDGIYTYGFAADEYKKLNYSKTPENTYGMYKIPYNSKSHTKINTVEIPVLNE